MHIVINQSNNVFGMDAENKIFAQSTETITFDVTFSDPQATLQGLYCALLSDGGKTLALATISENKAVLDTNTTECVEYVAQWAIGTTRHAFIVVGESTKPLAIIDVEVSQNPLEGLRPPTESAPSDPTSAELQAILAEVKAQAKTASESAQSANQDAIFVNTAKTEVVRIGAQITTDRVLISGYASTASSGASRAEEAKRIAVNASENVSNMQDEIGATKTKIDATAKIVQSNADAVAGAKKEIDTAISTATTAINDAVGKAETAKGDAVKAQGEASKSAENASTSAENAAQSATTASNKAQEAKESALTAVNATALKVDQRINTEDNSEYPLIVMVDKDVYKFIAPKGATNAKACRYCCDGTAHYFGFLSGDTRGDLYEYDDSLKFVRKVSGVHFGQKFYGDPYAISYDFCTKLHNIVYKKDEQGNDVVEREYDAYYIRNCGNPYTTQYIRKYDESGTELAYVVVPNELSYGRVCRNERTNHLIFFSLFTDEATGEKQMGYTIYDADLNKIGERRIDAKYDSSFSWLQHLNIVGNTTLISFAPKDETLTALFYLDENDDIIPVTGLADRYGEFILRGSGKFTDIDSTATGRIGKMYIVPRMFYDYRTYNTLQHVIIVTNGARICKLLVDSSGDTRYAITADYYGGNRAIKTATVPDSRYDALSLFFANGSGSTTGSSTFSQPMANLSETGIVTKAFDTYKAPGGYTEFAPAPFPNTSNFPRGVTGNAHPTSDTKATPRAYQLYPAGNYGQAGGAIMFTI